MGYVMDLYMAATGLDGELLPLPAGNGGSGRAVLGGETVRTSFCRLVRGTPEGAIRCEYQMHQAGRQALDLGQPYVFVCHAGLVEWAAPVVCGQEYMGSAIAGRVRMWELDDEAREEVQARVADLRLDPDSLGSALDEVPFAGTDQVRAASQLLFSLVCYHMGSDATMLQKQRKLWEERGCLAEEIARQKNIQVQELARRILGKELAPVTSGRENGRRGRAARYWLSPQNERELVGRIRLGNRSGAKEILNQILGDIFLNGNNDLNLAKARLIELLTSVGRAGVQAQTPWEGLFELYLEAVEELRQAEDAEGLYHWTVKSFDRLMDAIYISRDRSNFAVVKQVTDYLEQHFSEEININKVAQEVHLSPFYLSRLFKEELGLTIVEYLTDVRLGVARNLLEKTDLTVTQVSERVGYQDPAYFSRIFKKRIGVSPKEYQRRWRATST
ncbi:MAG: PocR ligand-binding domain-containing protein [Clostridia bacterium]|nr:PocR ligand-binding domain-containing protein [Clostridia bacterium]